MLASRKTGIYREQRVGLRTARILLARWFAELFFDSEDGGDTLILKGSADDV
jgi:hypothetical protein